MVEPKRKTVNYKRKYIRLKRLVKEQVFINAALYDEIGHMEQQFIRSKSERKYLLKRLFQYLPMTESQVLQSTQALKSLESTFPGKIPQSILSPVQPGVEQTVVSIKKKKKSTISPLVSSTKSPLALKKSEEEKKGEADKPKRKKPGTVKKKVLSIHLNDLGVPLFPITLGTLTVYDLGEVVSDRPGFHSERYIWPVGYCSTRLYPSMLDPDRRIQYFCYIKDGGSDPLFEIIAEDEPETQITAVTATACHCIVLKRLNKARGKDATNTGSGPEFFGFSHSSIQYLIQCLPGADKCERYNSVKFELPQSSSSSTNVISDDNVPNMELYDRSKLELPEPRRTMDID